MTHALKANTRVAYIAEVTENVTPDDPVFQILRATGESLAVDRKYAFSSELDGQRGQKNFAVASAMGSGGIEAEFSDGTFESLFEGLLRGAWTSDVLVNGDTPKTFTFEVAEEAGATDIFKRLTGAHMNTAAITLVAGEVATLSLGMMSRGSDFANAIVSGATYAAAGTDPIEIGATVGNLAMAGLTVGCVPSLTLNVNNNIQAEYGLGNLGPCSLAPGELEITVSLSMFLTSAQYAMLRAYADGIATSLSFDLGSGVGTILSVNVPNLVLDTTGILTQDPNGSVLIEATGRALKASSLSGGVIELTRNV